jgi:hypothetical protein
MPSSFKTHPFSIYQHLPSQLTSFQCHFGLFFRQVQGFDALRATGRWDEAAGRFADPILLAVRKAPALTADVAFKKRLPGLGDRILVLSWPWL